MLVGLGVAAGDFIEANLHYLDYVVAAAVVLAVAWMVYRRVTDLRRQATAAGPAAPADGRGRTSPADRARPRRAAA